MLRDRYDNSISTSSTKARDLYIEAVDRLLAGAPCLEEGFAAVTEADPDFALAHCGLARARQIMGDISGARAAMSDANNLADGLSRREATHLHVVSLLIEGNVADTYRTIRAHVTEYPRDVIVAQTCTSIFGLIGLSGQPGREAELLAYTTTLAPHYQEDWWFLGQHAFSLVETGQTARAAAIVDRSLALNPHNAHAAHVRAHVHYEAGEAAAGLAFLDRWLTGYDKKGIIHGHLSWHVALWAMEQGDPNSMWRTIDTRIVPGATWGRPLNVLSDSASILFRAGLAGIQYRRKGGRRSAIMPSGSFPRPESVLPICTRPLLTQWRVTAKRSIQSSRTPQAPPPISCGKLHKPIGLSRTGTGSMRPGT